MFKDILLLGLYLVQSYHDSYMALTHKFFIYLGLQLLICWVGIFDLSFFTFCHTSQIILNNLNMLTWCQQEKMKTLTLSTHTDHDGCQNYVQHIVEQAEENRVLETLLLLLMIVVMAIAERNKYERKIVSVQQVV